VFALLVLYSAHVSSPPEYLDFFWCVYLPLVSNWLLLFVLNWGFMFDDSWWISLVWFCWYDFCISGVQIFPISMWPRMRLSTWGKLCVILLGSSFSTYFVSRPLNEWSKYYLCTLETRDRRRVFILRCGYCVCRHILLKCIVVRIWKAMH
jgi:hypothetical protein